MRCGRILFTRSHLGAIAPACSAPSIGLRHAPSPSPSEPRRLGRGDVSCAAALPGAAAPLRGKPRSHDRDASSPSGTASRAPLSTRTPSGAVPSRCRTRGASSPTARRCRFPKPIARPPQRRSPTDSHRRETRTSVLLTLPGWRSDAANVSSANGSSAAMGSAAYAPADADAEAATRWMEIDRHGARRNVGRGCDRDSLRHQASPAVPRSRGLVERSGSSRCAHSSGWQRTLRGGSGLHSALASNRCERSAPRDSALHDRDARGERHVALGFTRATHHAARQRGARGVCRERACNALAAARGSVGGGASAPPARDETGASRAAVGRAVASCRRPVHVLAHHAGA